MNWPVNSFSPERHCENEDYANRTMQFRSFDLGAPHIEHLRGAFYFSMQDASPSTIHKS